MLWKIHCFEGRTLRAKYLDLRCRKKHVFLTKKQFFCVRWDIFLATVIIISGDISISFDHPTPRGRKFSHLVKNILSGTMCWRIFHPMEHILMGTRCVEGFCRYSNFAGTCQTWPSDQNCIFSLFKDGNILSANVLKGREGTTTSSLNHSFWQKKTSSQAQ